MVLTHVYDLIYVSNTQFIKRIRIWIAEVLTFSKIERDKIRFTGWDIEKYENQIRITMKDYVESMEKINEIGTGEDCHVPLTFLELWQYRKYIGKLSWLAEDKRLDLSYTTLQVSMKNAMATIADLHNVNRVLKKVEMKESGINYWYVGKKEDLRIVGIGDVLFKTSEKAVGGVVLLLASKDMKRASPILWN